MDHISSRPVTKEEYERTYARLSDVRLVQLVDHHGDIDPIAWEVAHAELDRRKMSNAELQAHRDMLLEEQAARSRTTE